MKNLISLSRLLVVGGAISTLVVTVARAEDTGSVQPITVTGTAPADQTAPAPTKLPYGVDDVLKLSRAQVGEDVIVNYVQNTGTIYNLSSQDIVYLKGQGVSDRVVNTMLDQRKRVSELAAQTSPPTAPPAAAAPAYDAATAAAPTYNYTQPTPAATQAAPASTLYVIPYPQATSAYYGYPYYPYYPYYSGYYGPSVSFGFSFGGGCGPYYRGGYYGGYHGGYPGHYYGGGYRGGGSYHH